MDTVAKAIFLICMVGPLSTSPGQATEEPPCTFEQMQTDPHSVVAPCSSILGDRTASSEAKANAFFVRGHGYARTARTILAAQDYDLAIKLAPMVSEYYVSRASTEAKSGNYQAQFTDLNHALTLDPRNAHAYRALGAFYADCNEQDQALQLYHRALSIDPHEPYALLNRINLFEQRHQFSEAFVDAQTLVEIPAAEINKLGFVDSGGNLWDFHAMALTKRAELSQRLGDLASAEQDFGSAVTQSRTPSTLRARGNFFLHHGRPDDAARDYDDALALNPDDAYSLYGRGLVSLGKLQFERAAADFEKAGRIIESNADDAYTMYSAFRMRARALRGLGKTDDAVALLEKAVAANARVHQETMRVLVARGYLAEFNPQQTMTPEYRAALRACMIDADCN